MIVSAIEDFALEFTVTRVADERTIFAVNEQPCRKGDSYHVDTTEAIRTCDAEKNRVVEITYTRRDMMVCEDGAWTVAFSVCLLDGCGPKIEVTEEACD